MHLSGKSSESNTKKMTKDAKKNVNVNYWGDDDDEGKDGDPDIEKGSKEDTKKATQSSKTVKPTKEDLIKEVLNHGALGMGLKHGKNKPEAVFPYSEGVERLDEDFNELNAPWVAPNIDVANERSKMKMYRSGSLNLSNTFLRTFLLDEKDLSLGVVLHFFFVKSTAICLFIMTILSIPSIILSYSGNHVQVNMQDGMGLYQFTVGNIGFDQSNKAYLNQSSCGQKASALGTSSYNGTCLHAFGQQLTSPEVAGLLTLFEVLQILAFFCFVLHLRRRVLEITDERMALKTHVKLSDYSIVIRGLPIDTTEEELVMFFSELYPLDRKDWKDRPAVQDARPVDHCEHTPLVPFVKGTWVAECSLYHSMAKFISFYRMQHKLMIQLFRERARMKMFSEKTVHAHGANARFWGWAEARMIKISKKIDKLSTDFVASQRLKIKGKDKAVNKLAMPKAGKATKSTFNCCSRKKKVVTIAVEDPTAAATVDAKETKKILGPDGKPAKTIFVPDPNDPALMIEIIDPSVLLEAQQVAAGDLAASVLNRTATDLVGGLLDEVGKSKMNIVGSADAEHLSKDDGDISKKFKERKLLFAFVTFEYVESMARCIEDYAAVKYRPSWMYPAQLKFKGHRIDVQQAPEPSRILWDNIEEPTWRKFSMRARTAGIIFLLVVLSYAIIVQASSYQVAAAAKLPSISMCSKEIPMLFNQVDFEHIGLTYPPTTNGYKERLDGNCNKIVAGSFYAQYGYNGRYDQPGLGAGSTYSLTQCNIQNVGLCPNFQTNGTNSNAQGPSTYCPCISTTDVSQSCQTSACFLPPSNRNKAHCLTFKANLLGTCYCAARLTDALNGFAGSSLGSTISNSADECHAYFIDYVTSLGINYAVIAVLVCMNVILKWFIRTITRTESHSSFGKAQCTILRNVFISIFVNFAFVPIVAFGYWPGLPSIFNVAYIFQGIFPDFTLEWYGAMGSFLLCELIFHIIIGLIAQMGTYLIVRPFTRSCYYPFVLAQSSYFVATQYDLHKIEFAPYFNPASQSGNMLALLFFAMTFASGLPFMMPLACIAFLVAFAADKLLFCMFYRLPPKDTDDDNVVMLKVVSLLPYAAMLRLAFGCWMLSSRGVFVIDTAYGEIANLNVGGVPFAVVYRAYLTLAQTQIYSLLGSNSGMGFIFDRVLMPNTFPLFLLLVVIVLLKLLVAVIKKVFGPIARLIWETCVPLCKRQAAQITADGKILPYEIQQLRDPLRKHTSPFTGDYVQMLRKTVDNDKPPRQPLCSCIPWPARIMRNCCPGCKRVVREDVSEIDAEDGWKVEVTDDYVVKTQVWEEMTSLGGITRLQGEKKRTYEVIMGYSCHTYMFSRMPIYRLMFQSTGPEGLNDMILDASMSVRERYNMIWAEDLFASVGNGGDEITERYLFKKAGRTVKKNDAVWEKELGTDDERRAKLTDEEKTKEAFDKFWDVGNRPEEDVDDDEWNSEEYESGSDDDNYEYYSEHDGDEGDEEKLVD